jgi:DNA helicase-2/ATP-dependent DNA helicase PcrA
LTPESPAAAPPPIVAEELAELSRVRAVLLENPEPPGANEHEVLTELVRLQEEVRSARPDDRGAIAQQMEHYTALLDQIRKGRKTESVDVDSPYFAHLRLAEKGRKSDIYIGRASRLSHGLRIVDWRNAPISRLFYRYEEGDEYCEELGDQLREGRITARRTLHIADGTLLRVGAGAVSYVRQAGGWRALTREGTHLAGGQGSALRAGKADGARLGSGAKLRADKHLPDIAALIDPDQFALITAPSAGVVVLRGSAGSGKTTVALHRVAYLAFQLGRAFVPQAVLIIVWGRAMRDYVANVLPALGVAGVQVSTWTAWSRSMVARHFPELPGRSADDTPEPVSRMKLHPAFIAMVEAYIRATPGKAHRSQVIEDWMRLTTDRPRIEAALGEALSDSAMQRALAWTNQMARSVAAWMDGEKDADVRLDPEDDALLLRMYQLRVGHLVRPGARPLHYHHLVLDEVQDFSPVEVSVLISCTDERKSVTLAGDTRQHISTGGGFTSWTEFLGRIGVESTALNTLQVSYRSTHPITRFALDVLGDDDEPAPRTTRDGPPVELFRFSEHGAAVGFLAEELRRLLRAEPNANVAILTPHPELSRTYAQGLRHAEVPRVRLVVEQEFAFAPGVDVVEAREVKGLEFDYVVLVEVSALHYPDTPYCRRLLHVAATRAVHQLWLTCVGTPSPLLPEQQP